MEKIFSSTNSFNFFVNHSRFHAIYWPVFLLAAELALPHRIIAHGHWLIDGKKMSKSIGNVVDPQYLMKKYGVDQLRYFLLRDGGLNSDAGRLKAFIRGINSFRIQRKFDPKA